MDNVSNQISMNEYDGTPIEERFAIIEACLFAAGHPITYARLGEVMEISPADARDTVEKMAAVYNDTSTMPRGILLVMFPDSCQLCTREEYAADIKIALGIKRGGHLSQSLLEVLAVIAYNQPTTRTFIDTVRGVESSYAVNSLLEKNLIEPCGKLDAPGRPTLFRTTNDFLRVFGLSSLEGLPTVRVKSETGEMIELAASSNDVTDTIPLDIDGERDTPTAEIASNEPEAAE